MVVEAFEGIVEKGRIRILNDVALPEQTRVYVVVQRQPLQVPSPGFICSEQARDFEKIVLDVTDDVAHFEGDELEPPLRLKA
jgi:hypothetical protein